MHNEISKPKQSEMNVKDDINVKSKLKQIQLAHGGGGRLTDELISNIILKHIPHQDVLTDGAIIESGNNRLAFTTDSYVVNPIFFPGGDVGKLAICGTCNDIAVSGAKPIALSLALIIEEGLEISQLDAIMQSISESARQAEVKIVTGDTKVVPKNQADSIYINTAGIGAILEKSNLGFEHISEGDKILINGTIGDHGLAVMALRENLRFQTTIKSDVSYIGNITEELIQTLGNDIKFLRDPTRAGIAGVLNDIADNSQCTIIIEEQAIPINPSVKAAAEILGLDLLTVANEGKFIAVVSEKSADKAIDICKKYPEGSQANIIGHIESKASSNSQPAVILRTAIGGRRFVQKPYGEQLPRIC